MTQSSREKLLKALIDVGQELASTFDLDQLLTRILAISREVFGFEHAIIRLLDEDGRHLRTVAAHGFPPEAAARPLRVGEGVMGRVAANAQPLLVPDVALTADYVPGIEGARSEMAVPMLVGERLVGVFNIESPRPNAFSDDDVAPLLTLAGQAAIAIENARLYRNLKNVSDRYRQLGELNQSILNSASIGIYTVDREMTIASWNRKMEELSGVAESDALGRNLFALFPGLEQEGFGERIRRVAASGQPERLRLAHRNLRGEMRFQKRRLTPLIDHGATVGVVVLVEDITEFKQLLDQTIQSEKLAEIGRLSAALAHEVNNPLAVIVYAAQLLLREEEVSPFQLELLERIESESERLKALTGSLLSFSRDGEAPRRITDLNEVLGDVLRLIRYEFIRRGVSLHEDLGSVPLVTADPNRIKQVFINLAMNAAQALPAGGMLTVRSGRSGTGDVEVVFADNGPGIPEPLRERIFEPFFTTKKSGEGTGLGLYICRTIVQEHEGRLLAESPPGGGAVFRLLLPPA